MSPMRIIILVLSAVAAIGAAFLVQRISRPDVVTQTVDREKLVVDEVEVSQTEVLTANRDFLVGEIVKPEDLVWAPWPEGNVLDTFFTKGKSPEAIKEIAGSIVRTPIYKLEPIVATRLVKRGQQGLLASLLEPGMRAVAVEISTESASGGFILPNDYVDIILTHEEKANPNVGMPERTLATTIVKNVRVLAIDQAVATAEDAETSSTLIGSTATLELTPDEAELVSLSQRKGKLSLSLRPLALSGPKRPREPRLDLLDGKLDTPGEGIMIIRNGESTPAIVGG